MTDVPIIFSAPMVLALLEGRKVLTRRLAWRCPGKASSWQKIKAGDRLWVRETHYVWSAGNQDGSGRRISYRASDPGCPTKWTPAIHMPRWASRIDLGVTMTRMEPVHEISDLDAIAEGIQIRLPKGGYFAPGLAKPGRSDVIWPMPTEAFSHLWETLHGPDSWTQNPQVVVIGFQVLKRP